MRGYVAMTAKEVAEFLMASSSMILTDGASYIYFPYWMKTTNKEGVFEILKWDNLPNDLKNHIQEQRTQENLPRQEPTPKN